jgi:hypothetical protein
MKFAADDPIEGEAGSAVESICKNLSTVFNGSGGIRMPQSEGSSVLFLRRRGKGSVSSDRGKTFIPTPHLLAIFERERLTKTRKEALELFYALSSHSLTRGTAGWLHEKAMHNRLVMGTEGLSIFQDGKERLMRPSNNLLTGTLAGLKEAEPNSSFYWIPTATNFPGVDSVLGDTDGHVYTIQATIGDDHVSPDDGIKKVWAYFDPAIRTSRIWHYVVIADSKKAANAYLKHFSEELCNFTLGKARAPVQVWACVLSSLQSL